MLHPDRPLFVATNRVVIALHPRTGRELWRTRLPNAGSLVSLIFSDGWLFAGCGGNVYGINPADGRIIWNNGLPGTGYQAVIMAREGVGADLTGPVSAEVAAQAAAAESAAG